MFRSLGVLTQRFRLPIILFWIAAVVILTLISPNLDDVTSDDQGEFLPDDADSIVAQAALAQYFPHLADSGNVILVFDAGEGESVLSSENQPFIEGISLWLAGMTAETAPVAAARVDSPILNPAAAAASLLMSGNERVASVVVSITPEASEDDISTMLADIRTRLDDAPAGLASYRTGQISTGLAYTEAVNESVSSTAFVTISLVAVILLLVFRSPVSPLIPLIIVTIALMVTQNIIAILAESTLTVSSVTTVLIVVVIYGAGTDYCLFLISRFREELGKEADRAVATGNTVRFIGESIFNSAATTATGFLAMVFTQFGLFNTTGPILAISLVVTLAAATTLTPAVLSYIGDRAFWPGKITVSLQNRQPRIFTALAGTIRRAPILVAGVLLVLAIPLAIYGTGYEVTFDFLSDVPADREPVQGFEVLEQEIGSGDLQPTTVIIELPEEDVLSTTADLTAQIMALEGVKDVRSAVQPLGSSNEQTAGLTRLNVQLGALAQYTAPQEGEPTEQQIEMMTGLLTSLPEYFELIAQAAPELTQTDAFAETLSVLENADPTPDFAALSSGLGALSAQAPDVHIALSSLPEGVLPFFGGEAVLGLVESFFNRGENVTRMDIVLWDAPYTTSALDTVEEVNALLDRETPAHFTAGATATTVDLREIIASDLQLTVLLVLGGIFLILVIMLRSLVAPIYLLFTIGLSYLTTLGMTRLATGALFGQDELVFWVPFLIFVFLVALGIDYSILLFSRIKEQMERGDDMQAAVYNAVAATGSIIASAGFIVAGSFIALITSDIVGLKQIGFAVGAGILVDTIIVRTMLVPAIAFVIGRWSWFPGPLFNQSPDSVREASPRSTQEVGYSAGAD